MTASASRRTVETHRHMLAYLALAGGILCISFAGVFSKLAHTTGDVVGALRLTFAALLLSGPAALNWQRGGARLPRSVVWIVVLGGLTFALDAFIWNSAVRMTTVANATLLGNTAPIWVSLGALLFLRERLRPAFWPGLVIAMAGMALVMGLDALRGLSINRGDVLAAAAGICYGTYQLITKHARNHVDNMTYMWVFTVVGAIVLLILTQVLGHPLTDLPLSSYLALFGLALVTHTGGWWLVNYAFGRLPASLVSVTLLAQAVVATLLAMPILGEVPGVWQVVGGLVTLGGIYIVHRSGPKSSQDSGSSHAECNDGEQGGSQRIPLCMECPEQPE